MTSQQQFDPRILLAYPVFKEGLTRIVYAIKPEPFASMQPLLIWRRAGGVYASSRYSVLERIPPTDQWHVKATCEKLEASTFEGEVRYCVDHRWLRGHVSAGVLRPVMTLSELEQKEELYLRVYNPYSNYATYNR